MRKAASWCQPLQESALPRGAWIAVVRLMGTPKAIIARGAKRGMEAEAGLRAGGPGFGRCRGRVDKHQPGTRSLICTFLHICGWSLGALVLDPPYRSVHSEKENKIGVSYFKTRPSSDLNCSRFIKKDIRQ